MKYRYILTVFIYVLYANSCKKEEVPPRVIPACIQEKIEAFGDDPDASHVIRIDKLFDTHYGFVRASADGGIQVYNADCEFVCAEECWCTGVPCDPELFKNQITTIHRY